MLEDDPYGRVRFDGEPLPTLHELDGGEHVLYSSSFSKIVAPGARVGYFVLTADVAAALDSAAQNVYLTPALIGQATVYEFIRRGSLEPNIARVSELLRARRDAMLETLDRELPDGRFEQARGRLLRLARLPGLGRCRRVAGARRGGRSHLRAGLGLLPGRKRRRAAARPGSRSATCRRTRSARACHGLRRFLLPALPV